MSSSARGWLIFTAMLTGALIAVALVASALQSYETRPEDPNGTGGLHAD